MVWTSYISNLRVFNSKYLTRRIYLAEQFGVTQVSNRG